MSLFRGQARTSPKSAAGSYPGAPRAGWCPGKRKAHRSGCPTGRRTDSCGLGRTRPHPVRAVAGGGADGRRRHSNHSRTRSVTGRTLSDRIEGQSAAAGQQRARAQGSGVTTRDDPTASPAVRRSEVDAVTCREDLARLLAEQYTKARRSCGGRRAHPSSRPRQKVENGMAVRGIVPATGDGEHGPRDRVGGPRWRKVLLIGACAGRRRVRGV